MKVKGLDKLVKQLKHLEKTGANLAGKKAIRAGTTVMAKAIKAATPVDEGLLKKSQTSKVGGKKGRAFGVIGADKAKLDAEASYSGRPSNIDFLVEYGHVAPDGTVIPPSGYHRRAEAAATPAAMAAVAKKLSEEIQREAAK